MTLERRIAHLEGNLKGQDTVPQPQLSADDVIRRFGFDPDTIKATASRNQQSIMEVIAAELGVPYEDFQKALKMRARGEQPT
jgi:hypothetical protein